LWGKLREGDHCGDQDTGGRIILRCIFRKWYNLEERDGGACGTYGGWERCSQVLVGKPERKRPLWRPRRRWEDNIKMDFLEVGEWRRTR